MSGFGVVVRVIGVAGAPRRSLIIVSQPTVKIPMRSSDVETSCPRPLRLRAKSAAATPPAPVMPAVWSPIAPRWYGGAAFGAGNAAAGTPRAHQEPTSRDGGARPP